MGCPAISGIGFDCLVDWAYAGLHLDFDAHHFGNWIFAAAAKPMRRAWGFRLPCTKIALCYDSACCALFAAIQVLVTGSLIRCAAT
jgi:hypothetical protein